MSDGFGSELSHYSASVGRCFFVAMVARIYDPGCKHDYMPVFEGFQGVKKSSALGIIGGKWFAEQHEDITKKDFFQNLPGKILFEISELHAFKRSEVERIKGVISCQSDRYRGSYDRRSADHPRMSAFAGTTNRDDWVVDDTGARRFWPIRCTIIDSNYLRSNREQLFAEAIALYKRVPLHASAEDRISAGADWWTVDPELAKAEVELRRNDDVWTAPVIGYARLRKWVTVAEIMENALKIPIDKHGRSDEMRVASILRVATFVRKPRRYGNQNLKAWLNPALANEPDGNEVLHFRDN
jgi:predicted P-loop ATPase